MQLTNKILKELEDPKNREIVNSGQEYFDVIYDSVVEQAIFWFARTQNRFALLDPLIRFMIIRYCINLLPCFDVENPEYRQMLWQHRQQKNMAISNATIETDVLWGIVISTPKTIRQALLCSGAMTVEDLEQTYKQLIK